MLVQHEGQSDKTCNLTCGMRNVLRKPARLLKGIMRFMVAVQLLVERRQTDECGSFVLAVADLFHDGQGLFIEAQGLLQATYIMVHQRYVVERGSFAIAVADLALYRQGLLIEAQGL